MKNVLDKMLYGGMLSAVLLCPAVFADDAAKPAATEDTPTMSVEFVDPAFDRYIDISLLGIAWENQDAAALTDAAIQLAEGEKVLFRSHKCFPAKVVFEKALAVAADQKDTATLERLAKVAKACDCKDFAAKVSQTTKLAAESRSVTPDVDLLKAPASEESLAYVQYLMELISRIRVVGDKDALVQVEKAVKGLKPSKETISQGEVDSLLKLVGESRAAMGDVASEDQQAGFALEKLAGESRWPPPPGWGPPPKPGWGPPPGPGWKPPPPPWPPKWPPPPPKPGPWGPKPKPPWAPKWP